MQKKLYVHGISLTLERTPMSNFIPVSVKKFVRQYMQNNKDADADTIRVAVEDALAAKQQGVRCACGNPLWVAGSAVAGYGCFTCISGSAEPDGDPEIVEACEDSVFEAALQEDRLEEVGTIIRNHPWDYVEQLEAAGFTWYDDDFDMLYEEETKEEQSAFPENENQHLLVRFFKNGGPVTRQVLHYYLKERYSESSNIPLVRKFFKRANPNLKAILLAGLAANPTDPDLLDDLAYFSEFDSMLGELIHFYTDACLKETDMQRFSLLVQDFHMNTVEQGYDALKALARIFNSGTKGAVVQHLSETLDDHAGPERIPF
jgi:hypothetical protein